MSDYTSNSNNNSNNNSNQIKYRVQQPPGIIFLKTFLISLSIIIPLLLVNANILYFLTVAPNIVNKWFPTNCNKYPYGSDTINPCGGMDLNISKICLPIIGGGGVEEGGGNIQNKGTYGTLDRLMFGPEYPSQPGFPYKYYSKKYDNVIVNYFSWIISGLAKTNIGLNSAVNGFFTNETIRACPSILLLLLGFAMILLLPFVFFYSIIGNTFNKFLGVLRTGFITKAIIFFTVITGCTFIFDLLISIKSTLSLVLKIILGPLLTSRGDVLRGIAKEARVISFIIGAAFIIALVKTPFDKNIPEKLIKGIAISVYLFFLIITIIISISKNM